MSSDEETAAATRLIERLLTDHEAREAFRGAPATVLREAGLERLAGELADGVPSETLHLRESRSSLSGALAAAAVEGIGLIGFSQHVVPLLRGPAADAARGAVGNLTGRMPSVPREQLARQALSGRPQDLPRDLGRQASGGARSAVAGGRGSLRGAAQDALAGRPPGGTDAAAPPGGAAAAAPQGTPPPAAAPPSPAAAAAPGGAPPALARAASAPSAPPSPPGAPAVPAPATAPPPPDAALPAALAPPSSASAPLAPAPPGSPSAPVAPAPSGSPIVPAPPGSPPAPLAPAPAAAPGIPATPGGLPAAPAPPSGGVLPAAAAGVGAPPGGALPAIPGVTLVEAPGAAPADPTVLRAADPTLRLLAREHTVAATVRPDGAVEVTLVDGAPVGPGNLGARDVVGDLAALDPATRPVAVSSPWGISAAPGFSGTSPASIVVAPAPPPADLVAPPSTLDSAPTPAAGPAAAPDAAPAPAAPGAGDAAASGAVPTKVGAFAVDFGSRKAHAAVQEAMKYLGTDYKWGGASPTTGFDCSGLLQWAYAQQGIKIPRVTYDQVKAGVSVPRGSLREGDLILFAHGGDIHHVGVYLGDGKFLHAPKTGDVVKVSSLDEPYFKGGYYEARRVTPLDPPGAGPTPATAGGPAPAAAGGAAQAPAAASAPGEATPGPDAGAPAAPAPAAPAPADAVPAAPAATPAAAEPPAPPAAAAAPVPEPLEPGTATFEALKRQEASYLRATAQFEAVGASSPVASPGVAAVAAPADAAGAPPDAAAVAAGTAPAGPGASPAAGAALDAALPGTPRGYPGDAAPKAAIARWMGEEARRHGLPRELPVMASLVESGLSNLPGGDADSAGFFQMRVGIWDKGVYRGYTRRPELQVRWFIDQALAYKARQGAGFGKDPAGWGDWIANVERPAAQYRFRYQLRLAEARRLLGS